MRFVIEVTNGLQLGKRWLLRANEQMTFGRTERADVSFPEDDQMSSIHFQVVLDRVACHLTDLQSSNGLFVNDEQVSSCVLRHHDVIRAGGTNFLAHLEGGLPNDAANEDSEAQKTMTVAQPVSVAKKTRATSTDTFPLETCPSGLVRVTGIAKQITPIELAESLASKIPMYLLVDPHRFDAGDEQIRNGELLLDWLDPEAGKQVSPLFMPATAENMKNIETGWSTDAIVGIFSTYAPEELLAGLRDLSKPRDEKEGMLGFFWPIILQQLLNSQRDIGEKLTTLASAFLVEDAKDPEKWQLLGGNTLTSLLDQVGLKHAPVEPAKTETTA